MCLLSSNDKLLPPDSETIATLKSKHPNAPTNLTPTAGPGDIDTPQLSVDEACVLSSIKSMRSGSSGGLDGIRPIILQQLIGKETVENGRKLLVNITKLWTKM